MHENDEQERLARDDERPSEAEVEAETQEAGSDADMAPDALEHVEEAGREAEPKFGDDAPVREGEEEPPAA